MEREEISQEEFKEQVTEVLEASKRQPDRMNASLDIILETCSVTPEITVEYTYNVKELH